MFYSKEECLNIVLNAIRKSKAELTVEHSKLDFKAKWYNLNDPKQQNDFIKDTSAIANTFGPDGFIIIGYDDKSKAFHNTKFSDSGYADNSRIMDLLAKRLSNPFAIEIWDELIDGYSISIIHIPPSIQKPHVIRADRKFERDGKDRIEAQRIYVRDGSTNRLATYYDIELMYYDRKNIIPEYNVESYIQLEYGFNVNAEGMGSDHFRLVVPIDMMFENLGRRPLFIQSLNLRLVSEVTSDYIELFPDFKKPRLDILIKPGELTQKLISFSTQVEQYVLRDGKKNYPIEYDIFRRGSRNYTSNHINLKLHNGILIESQLSILKRVS